MKKEIKLTKTESPLLIKANGFFFALFGRPRAEREMNLSAETFSAERFIFTTALQAKNFLSQVRDDDAPSKIAGEKKGWSGAYSLSIQTHKYVCIERLSSHATNKKHYCQVDKSKIIMP